MSNPQTTNQKFEIAAPNGNRFKLIRTITGWLVWIKQ